MGGYRRKANWNKLDAWSIVAKYLDTPGLGKASRISKEVRMHIISSPAFRAVLSKHRLGRQYDGGDKQGQSEYIEEDEDIEEEMEEEEEAEDYDVTPNQSPVMQNYKIPQTLSPEMLQSEQDPIIRSSVVTKPVNTSLNNAADPFKRAQTQLKRLTSIKETLREQSEVDSIDKKDRVQSQMEDESMIQQMQQTKSLEKVPEMESKGSIFTETDGASFENSLPNQLNSESDPFKNDNSTKEVP